MRLAVAGRSSVARSAYAGASTSVPGEGHPRGVPHPRTLGAPLFEGANLFHVFWHILLAKIRAALVIMQDPNKQVIQVTIARFRTVAILPLVGELFAAALAATIPLLFAFILLQRYRVHGRFVSGMK